MKHVFLTGLALAAWLAAAPAAALESTPPAERTTVADFALERLDGGRATLSAYRGQVVVLTFWATWCQPCKQELPFLSRFDAADARVTVLAINTDGPETRSQVRRLVRSKKLEMPILLDSEGNVTQRLNPRKQMPLTLFLDGEGRLAATKDGFASGDEVAIEALLKQLVAEVAPPGGDAAQAGPAGKAGEGGGAAGRGKAAPAGEAAPGPASAPTAPK
ncbi:MAG: TlpA family protein disulfide reductase [Myxococcales bacterium]|nr:TlpA family protein disulfide reductase [Myxococcales bacterium]